MSVPDPDDAKRWYEFAIGERETIQVLAASPAQARERAQAELEDLGVLPGRPGRHESWRRLVRETS